MTIKLYSYWRSSAAYRVRIALELKKLAYEVVPVSLLPGVSEHRNDDYGRRNPQMLVPFLEDGEVAVGQSQAILEYLEERYPDNPLLPDSTNTRAAVRSFCHSICSDIHPLNNLRVLRYLTERLDISTAQRDDWYAHWIHEGFRSAELTAAEYDGDYVFGEQVSLADVCLIPQMYNARRFEISLAAFPRLVALEERCLKLPAFDTTLPEKQPDAT